MLTQLCNALRRPRYLVVLDEHRLDLYALAYRAQRYQVTAHHARTTTYRLCSNTHIMATAPLMQLLDCYVPSQKRWRYPLIIVCPHPTQIATLQLLSACTRIGISVTTITATPLVRPEQQSFTRADLYASSFL